MTARYYSVRRMAPFQGTMQVVALDQARAYTADGLAWTVDSPTEQARGGRAWGSMEPLASGQRFFTYGVWSAQHGIKRVPVNALLGDQAAHPGLAPLRHCLDTLPALPFPPADHWEHWLMDRDGQPLALLETRVDSPQQSGGPLRWRATHFSDHGFQSDVVPAASGTGTFPVRAKDVLEQGVMKRSTNPPRGHWFNRALASDDAFPPLLLREDWPDPTFTRLVQDYFDWLSPLLLTLWQLPTPLRARLEAQAVRHAERLHAVRRLVPEVIDQHRFDAALVEAVLRTSH